MKAHVYSEIGRLQQVILHKPGRELDNMIPQTMERLLYDDIPDAVRASEEYDAYLKIFHDFGTETLFIEDLLVEALDHSGKREAFVDDFLAELEVLNLDAMQKDTLKSFYLGLPTKDLVESVIAGIRKEEAPFRQTARFEKVGGAENPMIVDPLTNMVFTRDPFVIMGSGVSINSMYADARRRETLFGQYVFDYHPELGGKTPQFLRRGLKNGFIEGGDILLLAPDVVAVGVSQRTTLSLVEQLALSLLSHESHIKHVLAIRIPAQRAFMHLDTVLTQLDRDKFVIHPAIEGVFELYDMVLDGDKIRAAEQRGTLDQILCRYLHLDQVTLIRCGGGSVIDAAREQWNDGSNTLALAPGEVIVYERNRVTNSLLEEAGIKLHKLQASELARGRGGPHCMSMPLSREL